MHKNPLTECHFVKQTNTKIQMLLFIITFRLVWLVWKNNSLFYVISFVKWLCGHHLETVYRAWPRCEKFRENPSKRSATTTVTRLHEHHFQLSLRNRISQIEGLEGWKGRRRGMYRSDWLRCRSGIIYYNPARRASLFVHSPESLPVHRVNLFMSLSCINLLHFL